MKKEVPKYKNHKSIIKQISEEMGVDKKLVRKTVEQFLTQVMISIRAYRPVNIRGFGSTRIGPKASVFLRRRKSVDKGILHQSAKLANRRRRAK